MSLFTEEMRRLIILERRALFLRKGRSLWVSIPTGWKAEPEASNTCFKGGIMEMHIYQAIGGVMHIYERREHACTVELYAPL